MQHSITRLFCVALTLNAFWLTSCSAQVRSASALTEEWQACKQEFLLEIDRSLNLIFLQLDTHETALRNEGELAKVKALSAIRASFVEKGEIHPSVPRAEYDQTREQAVKKLISRKKELITQALQSKEDSIAEIIELEFSELSNPLIADVQARWAAAIVNYQKECDEAKSLIVEQLDKLEAKARAAADPSTVETAKKAKTNFLARGLVPNNITKGPYEARLEKEKERLRQVNKSLVRILLLNNHDDKASAMAAHLNLALNNAFTPAILQSSFNDDSRKVWKNTSYNTMFHHRQGDAWEEINSGGKLERKVKELSRTDDYVEILLIDRQHLMRLYKSRADMFKDGRWQWIANGEWVFE